MRKCLVTVAMGDKYIRMAEKMIESYLAYNPDWDVRRYYGDALTGLVPQQLRYNAFTICEIGRWLALEDSMPHYDQITYCDNDIRWYSQHVTPDHALVLSPHYVSNNGKRVGKHLIQLCGYCNLGIVTMRKNCENQEVFEYVIGETLRSPDKFMRTHCGERVLWLQNMVSCLPDCGVDVCYDLNVGTNVAYWNLKHDRELYKEGDQIIVRSMDGNVSPLVSYHFSASSYTKLDRCGDIVKELKANYAKEGIV